MSRLERRCHSAADSLAAVIVLLGNKARRVGPWELYALLDAAADRLSSLAAADFAAPSPAREDLRLAADALEGARSTMAQAWSDMGHPHQSRCEASHWRTGAAYPWIKRLARSALESVAVVAISVLGPPAAQDAHLDGVAAHAPPVAPLPAPPARLPPPPPRPPLLTEMPALPVAVAQAYAALDRFAADEDAVGSRSGLMVSAAAVLCAIVQGGERAEAEALVV